MAAMKENERKAFEKFKDRMRKEVEANDILPFLVTRGVITDDDNEIVSSVRKRFNVILPSNAKTT